MCDCEKTLIDRGYELGECVGRGSTADCFYVTHKNFRGVRFIAKIITGLDDKRKDVFAKIFQEEVNILTHIDHPNIVRCYDYFNDQYNHYIILEGCDKGNLAMIQAANPGLIQEKFLTFARQICSAVASIHHLGIAHMDIKPGNIFVNAYNQVKLADFGFSVCMKGKQTISKYIGSRFFMDPEVVKGENYDPFKADVYSLGMTLFVLSDPKFSKVKLDPEDIPAGIMKAALSLGEVGQIIISCINPDPTQRPTAQELENKFIQLENSTLHRLHNDIFMHQCTLVKPKISRRLSFANSSKAHTSTSMKVFAPAAPVAVMRLHHKSMIL